MRTQKNWFKVVLMTLAAVGLTIGALTLSASAQDNGQRHDGSKTIVILHNQFEAGTKVKVDGLVLLCVPTHKEIYEDDGTYTHDQKEEPPKDDYKYDHLACYKVEEVEDHKDDDKRDDDKRY
jgi:hypothetical protein